jgi:hypothetical protein
MRKLTRFEPCIIVVAAVGCAGRVAESDWSKSGKIATVAEIEIEIEKVNVGKPSIEIGEHREKLDVELLMISLIIRNQSPTSTFEYAGFDSFRSRSRDAKPTLQDESGNSYTLMADFGEPDVRLVGQIHGGSSLEPQSSAKDMLLFEPPDDSSRELRLRIPGAAFGTSQDFLFRVPAPDR